MTKKQKHRRNGFSADFNAGEDDFLLVDLDVMPDKEDPSPVPLNHFLDDDEETIDRLLVNSGFEANNELEGNDRSSDPSVIDNIDWTDDFSDSDIHSNSDFDEIPDEEDAIDRLLVDAGFDANDKLEENDRESDDLVIDDIDLADDFSGFDQLDIEPFEQAEQKRLTEAKEIPDSAIYSRADFDELPDEDGTQNAPVIDDVSQTNESGMSFKEQNAMAADKGIFDSKESALAIDKALNNSFGVEEEYTETTKQAASETMHPEEALDSAHNDAGITPFSSVISGQESIKKQMNDYQNKAKKANIIAYASLSFGIAALLSTAIMGVIISKVQNKVSKLSELVSILEEDMSSISEKNSDMGINNNDSSIEQLNQKDNGLSEHFVKLNNPQVKTSMVEKTKRSEASVEKVSAEKKVVLQKNLTEQSQSLPEPQKSNTITVAKKQATVKKSIDNQKNKTPVKITSAEKKTNNAKSASGWSVNLTAYNQLSDAKRKAAQLIQKGIPVKVITVDMNNTKWYRLKVGGFKNKKSADSYAAKIKKSLNLNAVSVGDS